MSKKDYVKLAAALASARPEYLDTDHTPIANSARNTWQDTRTILVDTLASDNPRFDRERFIEATESPATEV